MRLVRRCVWWGACLGGVCVGGVGLVEFTYSFAPVLMLASVAVNTGARTPNADNGKAMECESRSPCAGLSVPGVSSRARCQRHPWRWQHHYREPARRHTGRNSQPRPGTSPRLNWPASMPGSNSPGCGLRRVARASRRAGPGAGGRRRRSRACPSRAVNGGHEGGDTDIRREGTARHDRAQRHPGHRRAHRRLRARARPLQQGVGQGQSRKDRAADPQSARRGRGQRLDSVGHRHAPQQRPRSGQGPSW